MILSHRLSYINSQLTLTTYQIIQTFQTREQPIQTFQGDQVRRVEQLDEEFLPYFEGCRHDPPNSCL